MVNISLRVLSRPDALAIPVIARELGTDYDEKGQTSSSWRLLLLLLLRLDFMMTFVVVVNMFGISTNIKIDLHFLDFMYVFTFFVIIISSFVS